jgi:hypothetical protein
VLLASALLCAAPVALRAHDIPSRVTVLAFVKPDSTVLRLVLRVPLEAMRDVNWPQRGLEYLDIARAETMAADAARLWIGSSIDAFENGKLLDGGRVVATRISLPSDRSFVAYDLALAHVGGPALAGSVGLPWRQAMLDVVLEYPIGSATSQFSLDPRLGHLGFSTTTVLRFVAPNGVERAFEYLGDPGVVRMDPRWYHAATLFVSLGIRHILGGIDHLLFVLCLVVPFRRFRSLVFIVTSFTVAHSITLISAAMGVVPEAMWFPVLVETLVAASIVYMALENIVGAKMQRRWLIAFGFGLVHGFAFSFALRQSLQFAGGHVALSLLSFNLGVEIGQLLVLALAVPVLSLVFQKVVPERMGVIILSALVAHTAWHWMVDRGATLGQYQYSWPALDLAFAVSALRAGMVLVVIGGAVWGLSEVFRRFSHTINVPAVEPGQPAA